MKQKHLITILIVLAVIIVGIFVQALLPRTAQLGFTGGDNAFGRGTLHSSTTVSTTGKEIVTKLYNRQWMRVLNVGASSTGDAVPGGHEVYLFASSTIANAATTSGILLYGSSTLEFDSDNLYLDSISAVTATGSVRLLITECCTSSVSN